MEIEQTENKNQGHSEMAGKKPEKGFTLIELSIVLVIIGLIVGGILVGQDLIRAAEIRATVGQIEKYNSAINTFRSKFNGLPGDLTSDSASAFGFAARTGAQGHGDGNGLIQGSNSGALLQNGAFTQEAGLLWNDLSVANLVDGNYTTNAGNLDANAPVAIVATNVASVFPDARLERGNYIATGSSGSLNYWMIAGIGGTTANTGVYSLTANLTPIESYNMDVKLDDGMPETGIVQAHGKAGSSATPLTDASNGGGAAGACVVGTGSSTTDTYLRALTAGGAQPACIMRFRFN